MKGGEYNFIELESHLPSVAESADPGGSMHDSALSGVYDLGGITTPPASLPIGCVAFARPTLLLLLITAAAAAAAAGITRRSSVTLD